MELNFNYDDYETETKTRIKYKLDVLHEFRDYLNSALGKNTADTYYFAIKKFFDRLDFNEPEQVSLEKIESLILGLKTADDVNTIKAVLNQWKSCFPVAQIPDDAFMATASDGKSHVKREKKVLQPEELDTIKRKSMDFVKSGSNLLFVLCLLPGCVDRR